MLLQEVFGDRKWLWFMPAFSSLGDGLQFPRQGQNIDEDVALETGELPASSPSQRSNHHHHSSNRGQNHSRYGDAQEEEQERLLSNSSSKSWNENDHTTTVALTSDSTGTSPETNNGSLIAISET